METILILPFCMPVFFFSLRGFIFPGWILPLDNSRRAQVGHRLPDGFGGATEVCCDIGEGLSALIDESDIANASLCSFWVNRLRFRVVMLTGLKKSRHETKCNDG